MIEPFLFLECIVDVSRNERVHQVVLLLNIAHACTIDAFAFALWSWLGLGNKLLEKPNRRNQEGRFAVGHVAIGRCIEKLAQLMEQSPKGRAVEKYLKDCIRKTHVASVDEAARTNFHHGLAGWARCKKREQLVFFARGNGWNGRRRESGCRDGDTNDGRSREGIGF